MTTHEFEPTRYHRTFGSHEPVLHIADGDTLLTSTVDAGGADARGAYVAPSPNPQTGPFYVEGAEPGDTLAVHLEALIPNRDHGYCHTPVVLDVVEPGYVPQLPKRERLTWHIDLEAYTARLAEPLPGGVLRNLVLPLEPMLGCLGVAPPRGQAISTATSGPHGGNMDYRGYVEGVTAYFPVFVKGALLFLGDGHAVQGDGEVVGTGIETSFDVRLTVELLKGREIAWPRGESAEEIFTVGCGRPLDAATQHATTEMLRWLYDRYGLSAPAASLLLGQAVRYDLGNMCDPAYTMICRMSKALLETVRLR